MRTEGFEDSGKNVAASGVGIAGQSFGTSLGETTEGTIFTNGTIVGAGVRGLDSGGSGECGVGIKRNINIKITAATKTATTAAITIAGRGGVVAGEEGPFASITLVAISRVTF